MGVRRRGLGPDGQGMTCLFSSEGPPASPLERARSPALETIDYHVAKKFHRKKRENTKPILDELLLRIEPCRPGDKEQDGKYQQ